MERSEPVDTEERKEEETGTSLFHRVLNQRKDQDDGEVLLYSISTFSFIIETF